MLAASLRGTELAEVVSRRLADTVDTTTTGRPATPPATTTRLVDYPHRSQ